MVLHGNEVKGNKFLQWSRSKRSQNPERDRDRERVKEREREGDGKRRPGIRQ